MGVEVKGAGDDVVIAERMDNRKSNVSLRTLQRTRRLPV